MRETQPVGLVLDDRLTGYGDADRRSLRDQATLVGSRGVRGGGGKRNPIGVIPYDEEDGIDLSLFNEGGVPGIDILATKDTSQDGLPEDEGKGGGGEDIWFWRTLFQFRLPPYLQATEGQIQ